MLSIENARPTAKQLLNHIDALEGFCMGQQHFSPSTFREINEELSIGAVLLLGKRRYQMESDGKHLIWRGLDNREHDMGLVHDAHIMRDYPGFNAKRSRSLGADLVSETKIINSNISVVTLKDGSTGIGPNYRIALRNAALKMHLKDRFNFLSLSTAWNRVWGNA